MLIGIVILKMNADLIEKAIRNNKLHIYYTKIYWIYIVFVNNR